MGNETLPYTPPESVPPTPPSNQEVAEDATAETRTMTSEQAGRLAEVAIKSIENATSEPEAPVTDKPEVPAASDMALGERSNAREAEISAALQRVSECIAATEDALSALKKLMGQNSEKVKTPEPTKHPLEAPQILPSDVIKSDDELRAEIAAEKGQTLSAATESVTEATTVESFKKMEPSIPEVLPGNIFEDNTDWGMTPPAATIASTPNMPTAEQPIQASNPVQATNPAQSTSQNQPVQPLA